MRWLTNLFQRKPRPQSPLEMARAARGQALSALADARHRRDSRDIHAAHQRLREATTVCVRMELGL